MTLRLKIRNEGGASCDGAKIKRAQHKTLNDKKWGSESGERKLVIYSRRQYLLRVTKRETNNTIDSRTSRFVLCKTLIVASLSHLFSYLSFD